jgi:hypothetical protein
MATPRKKPEERKKMGAPEFPYTEEMADRICDAIATSTEGLEKICRDNPEFPRPTTIYKWKIKFPDFAKKYAQAKSNQADLYVEQLMEIANDTSRDTIDGKDGRETFNAEWVARSRLKIDTIKWIASKLIPKLYGDKNQPDSSDPNVTAALRNLLELRADVDKLKAHEREY